jgi:predicted negative regulator of RcsB-dependent stress response
MDEEVVIIDEKTRNEKIKNFILENKKIIIIIISIVIISFLVLFAINEIKKNNKIILANNFNNITADFETGKKNNTSKELKDIIKKHDNTYSPLALFFLIDNDLIENIEEGNILFDILINETKLEKEIKNLIIYKKALLNSGLIDENELLNILNPIINSNSVWKPHALYLIGEYFYSKDEKEKAKNFFDEILILKDINNDILSETQKRISRDYSE